MILVVILHHKQNFQVKDHDDKYVNFEVFLNRDPFDGFQSDHWSLGILLFMMLTKKNLVVASTNLCQRYRYILSGKLKEIIQKARSDLSDDVVDLLCGLLQINPSQRFTLQQIENHPWVRENNTTTIIEQSLPLPPSHQVQQHHQTQEESQQQQQFHQNINSNGYTSQSDVSTNNINMKSINSNNNNSNHPVESG